jgi:hypothetical protein
MQHSLITLQCDPRQDQGTSLPTRLAVASATTQQLHIESAEAQGWEGK